MFQSDAKSKCLYQRLSVALAVIALAAVMLAATSADLSAQYTPRKPGVAKETASIQVTGPAAGATLEKGKRHEITWTSTGIRGGVKIELVDTQGKATALIPQTTNSGKYSFTLMSNIADGDYTIRISTIDNKTVGKSAGVVHVGKTGDTSKQSTGVKPTPGITPSKYTPRTPVTETPSAAVTPSTGGTVAPAATADLTGGPASEVVRRDFSPIQVPASALDAIKLPKIEAGTITNIRPDVQRAIPSMIDVTTPEVGTAWQAGTQYPIRWASNDNISSRPAPSSAYKPTDHCHPVATRP